MTARAHRVQVGEIRLSFKQIGMSVAGVIDRHGAKVRGECQHQFEHEC